MKVECILKLYDDESVKKKLTVMDNIDAMIDDERNVVPVEWFKLIDSLKLGESIKLTVEKINEKV